MHVLQIFRIIVVKVWRTLANLAWDQDPHCRKKEKKSALAKKKNRRTKSLGRGWVDETGDKPLIPPISPLAINLSLKCQHLKFSSRMSALACYVTFVKKICEFEMK